MENIAILDIISKLYMYYIGEELEYDHIDSSIGETGDIGGGLRIKGDDGPLLSYLKECGLE